MHKVGVIADDLTGANDTGVQFSKYGLSTTVVLDIDAIGSVADQTDVLVVNADSRWGDPLTAYRQVSSAAEALKRAGVSRIYKKIDSALRGNVGAELDAVMDVFQPIVAFVVPAFPGTGRLTLGGKQLLENVPISETEMASDPLSPIAESHVPTLLTSQTRRRVGHVPLETVRSGVDMLRQTFQVRAAAGEQVVVVDAANQADLSAIAAAIASLDMPTVTAGSAGLAAEFPKALGLAPTNEQARSDDGRHGVLVMCGSISPTTRAQVEHATTVLGSQSVVVVSADEILAGLDKDQTQSGGIIEQARSSLRLGRDHIILVRPEVGLESRRFGALTHDQLSRYAQDSRKIAGYLGFLANEILAFCEVSGLVLIGGDTALAICKALGATAVVLLEEIIPGVPSGFILGGPRAGLAMVSKAGSFGEEDAIVRAIRYLHRDVVGAKKGSKGSR